MAVLLSRDAILAAPIATRDVEAFGGTVRIRALSLTRRLELAEVVATNEAANRAWLDDQEKDEDKRLGLARVDLIDQATVTIIYAMCDENNEFIFSVDDYPHFMAADYNEVAKVWVHFIDMNRPVSPDEQKKSSGFRRKGSSSSASRGTSGKPSKS